MELTPENVLFVGLIATLLAQCVKLVFAKIIKKPINRKAVTIIAYVPALIMAVYWAAPTMPVFPVLTDDPAVFVSVLLRYIGDLLVVATAVVGFAMVIYNLLLEKIYALLGLSTG